MKLLDLFCGGGGCAMGYHQAGFDEIIGVDIVDRPNYPFDFVKMDALEFLETMDLSEFDAIHASPPCQYYSQLKYLNGDIDKWEEKHDDLVAPTRELLIKTGKPYVIENVKNSPLINPITLYGEPMNKKVKHKTGKLGSGPAEDGFITVAGIKPQRGMNEVQTKLYYGFALGGIDWMDLKELTQCVPPAYTEFIGKQIIEYLKIQEEIKKGEQMNCIQKMLLSEEFVNLVRKYMVS